VSAAGSTSAAVAARAGQTAQKRWARSKRWSRGARGREPRFAQMRVSVPCWLTRASSWNQISSGLPRAAAGIASATAAAKFF
jgi:hypothetical protein